MYQTILNTWVTAVSKILALWYFHHQCSNLVPFSPGLSRQTDSYGPEINVDPYLWS